MVWATNEEKKSSSDQVVLEAVRLTLIRALEKGWRRIQVQIGDRQWAERFNKREENHATLSVILEDIQNLQELFLCCSFSHRNKYNGDICCLEASFSNSIVKEIEWEEFFPIRVANAAKMDMDSYLKY
ncbi:hypothetical protein ACH5RR_015868 [Cinchona calisaya]|uniref:RNase H type-1 domain-containing protein n=1 Tax=Cinchona calisaya TaxID=153742 RepID=A0ABD2ZUE0_9GENT